MLLLNCWLIAASLETTRARPATFCAEREFVSVMFALVESVLKKNRRYCLKVCHKMPGMSSLSTVVGKPTKHFSQLPLSLCFGAVPTISSEFKLWQVMIRNTETPLARVSEQLRRLEKRDWELWAIVTITGILASAGLLALFLP